MAKRTRELRAHAGLGGVLVVATALAAPRYSLIAFVTVMILSRLVAPIVTRRSLCRLGTSATVPEWATSGSFSSITRTSTIATYDTDYVLVRDDRLQRAIALANAGHDVPA